MEIETAWGSVHSEIENVHPKLLLVISKLKIPDGVLRIFCFEMFGKAVS